MNLRNFTLFLAIFCATFVAMAQEQNNTLPDLYTMEQEFFDPTRKAPKEEYKFETPWRLELGYAQLNHRTQDTSAVYMHGLKIGATVDFVLPHRFSIQTGALLTFTCGRNNQHWAPTNKEDAEDIHFLQHNLLQLQLSIPVRAYYSVNMWKKLNLFFYAGPQLNVGLTNYDVLKADVAPSTLDWLESQGIPTTPHDRYLTKELYRTNIQFGVGGGFEWDRYRLQAGYDFGLNNILRARTALNYKMNEWGWLCTFSYKL